MKIVSFRKWLQFSEEVDPKTFGKVFSSTGVNMTDMCRIVMTMHWWVSHHCGDHHRAMEIKTNSSGMLCRRQLEQCCHATVRHAWRWSCSIWAWWHPQSQLFHVRRCESHTVNPMCVSWECTVPFWPVRLWQKDEITRPILVHELGCCILPHALCNRVKSALIS